MPSKSPRQLQARTAACNVESSFPFNEPLHRDGHPDCTPSQGP
ncbi:hypothetical protein L914_05059 [Phytophthora nicotianae]|uniref:Uncharacterized protein n=1 Tax=Phytophthora nicotianae TaxID=4792 RepID=W2NQT2_PHYNI|nr:hypothetical protein L914_05059 [Phytophthora nicotianae]